MAGNTNRCPKCNKFGPGGGMLCRICREELAAKTEEDVKDGITPFEEFKARMAKFKEANPNIYKVALLEISQECRTIDDVPRKKRNEILGIMGTRINLKQKNYITDESMSTYGMGYKVPGENNGFVSDTYGCCKGRE